MECNGSISMEEKINCMFNMMKELKSSMLPSPIPNIESWPGNEICVSCNFLFGCMIGVIEVSILCIICSFFTKKLRGSTSTLIPLSTSVMRGKNIFFLLYNFNFVFCCWLVLLVVCFCGLLELCFLVNVSWTFVFIAWFFKKLF